MTMHEWRQDNVMRARPISRAVHSLLGTTGVACARLNRNFIGIEISEQYFEIAQRRIAEAQAQLTLNLEHV